MSTLAEIEAAAAALPPQEKAKLLEFLTAHLGRSPLIVSGAGRHSGLHAGVWEVAADFDAPLVAREIEFIAAVREGFESYEREGGTSIDEAREQVSSWAKATPK